MIIELSIDAKLGDYLLVEDGVVTDVIPREEYLERKARLEVLKVKVREAVMRSNEKS